MIESLLQKLIVALEENTAAHLGKAEPVAPAKKTKAALPDPTPEPEPKEEVTDLTPTKVAAPAKKPTDDTPNVPASAPPSPGQPVAAEHVDVDEVLAQINSIVKAKCMSGDTAKMKAEWEKIRRGKYGVDRMSDLKGEPAKLIAALADAKAL